MTSSEKEGLLTKDRLLLFAGLAMLTVFAWAYMLHMAWNMPGAGTEMISLCFMHWGPGDLAHIFIMWSIMMVAMMVPSSTPMVVMFATVNRQRSKMQGPLIPTWLFVLGYLIIWTAYSALVTMAQWGLHVAALLSHVMVITSPIAGGVLLAAAGVFQWSPFRDTCMTRCRSPLGFIMTEWREGRRGALMMGLKHGIYCVGCCWRR
jgi:predicted metal-binding membrane protein